MVLFVFCLFIVWCWVCICCCLFVVCCFVWLWWFMLYCYLWLVWFDLFGNWFGLWFPCVRDGCVVFVVIVAFEREEVMRSVGWLLDCVVACLLLVMIVACMFASGWFTCSRLLGWLFTCCFDFCLVFNGWWCCFTFVICCLYVWLSVCELFVGC